MDESAKWHDDVLGNNSMRCVTYLVSAFPHVYMYQCMTAQTWREGGIDVVSWLQAMYVDKKYTLRTWKWSNTLDMLRCFSMYVVKYTFSVCLIFGNLSCTYYRHLILADTTLRTMRNVIHIFSQSFRHLRFWHLNWSYIWEITCQTVQLYIRNE